MNALHYLEPAEFAEFVVDEIARYSRYGVTAIQPAEGSPSWYRGAKLLEGQGRLNVRLFPASDWLTSQLRVLDDEQTKAFIDDWKELRDGARQAALRQNLRGWRSRQPHLADEGTLRRRSRQQRLHVSTRRGVSRSDSGFLL